MPARQFASAYAVLVNLAILASPAAAALPAVSAGLGPGGIPVDIKQMGHCSAFAPRDWSLSTNPQGSTAEAQSRDKTMYAGWG